jgi:hypothetical protein
MSKAKFDFYEVVRVLPTGKYPHGVSGAFGAVLGRAETDDGLWTYTLSIEGVEETWSFNEEELEATGQRKTRSDFYDGTKLRVIVDPESGDGRID